MATVLASLRELVRTTFARERLDEWPRREARGRRRPSFGELLWRREELPAAPARARRRRPSLFALLFAREPLPAGTPRGRPPGRRSLVRALFRPGELPRAPSPGGARRSRWLAWIFAAERIDDS